MHYLVTWEIDICAETARAAAEEALTIQRNPASIATVFTVQAITFPEAPVERIDLTELAEQEAAP